MGIVGVGTDIVRIDRIAALHARHGERFARRVLGPQELDEFRRRRDGPAARLQRGLATSEDAPSQDVTDHDTADDALAHARERGEARAVRYLAKRFAAKEAFSKAIGLGLRGPMTLLSLQILNDPRGQPQAHPRKALAPWLAERGWRAHVSLSDEVDAALAFVIVEQHAGAGAGAAAESTTSPEEDE